MPRTAGAHENEAAHTRRTPPDPGAASGEILIHQPGPRASAILAGALHPPFRIRRVGSFRQLRIRLRRAPSLACLLDPFDSRPPVPLIALRDLRRRHPTVALVVASDFTDREMELYHLGRMGVDGVIRMEGPLRARDVRRITDEAIAARLAQGVVLHFTKDFPPLAQEAIRWAIEHGEARTQVRQFAAELALSPRAFCRELQALGLAPPRILLVWGRLIRASHLLERSHETVESVAFRLGYATGGNLSKALKRHVGCSPTELLRRGGLAWTLEAFGRKGLFQERSAKERWANPGTPRWRTPRSESEGRQPAGPFSP